VAPGADVRYKGAKVASLVLDDDSKGTPTVLELGSLRMFVINRQGRLALRVNDRNHPLRQKSKGTPGFP
jgi:hypothetical protein